MDIIFELCLLLSIVMVFGVYSKLYDNLLQLFDGLLFLG
jgi:hypothetical protein